MSQPPNISWSAPDPSDHNGLTVQGFGVGGGTGCGPGQSCSVQATAGLTFTLNAAWQGSNPPPPVILRETSVASFTGSSQANATNSGLADDGLNDPQVATSTGGVSQTSPSGTPAHYSARSGTAWHIDRTLSADGTQSVTAPPDNGAGAGMGAGVGPYSLDIYPITLNLGGTTQDSNGNQDILIGQHCSASLSGLPSFPSGYTVSYQWSVTGTTFQTWSADTPSFPVMVGGVQIGIIPENPDATYEVDGPGLLTNSTAGWYWNDLANGKGNNTQETVSCTATVTPPTGQGAALTVTATTPITVWTPVWTATGNGASVVVDNTYQAPDFWLHAGPGPLDFGATRGMTWDASLSPPSAPVPFGIGIVSSRFCKSWEHPCASRAIFYGSVKVR